MGRFAFAPRVVPTLAMAALVALTLWLGNWQVGRAEEKRQRQALFESRMNDTPVRLTGVVPAEGLVYRRVRVSGNWMPERQFFVDNRIRDGRAGFDVITPVRLDSGAAVLVNRGWVARGPTYPLPPEVVSAQGAAQVGGLAIRPPARFLELSPQQVAGSVWQNLSIERYAKATGLALVPVVVLQDPASPGLAAVRESPDAGIAKHVEYAFTWFSLAATAFVLWVVLNVKKVPA